VRVGEKATEALMLARSQGDEHWMAIGWSQDGLREVSVHRAQICTKRKAQLCSDL
jgi:hypothetical protein